MCNNIRMEESMETLKLRNKLLKANLHSVVCQNDMLRDMVEGKNKKTNQEILRAMSDKVLLGELERRLWEKKSN
jgi:hypothetical protein